MSNNPQEETLRRFKAMGIPVPLTPMNPEDVQLPVKNTEFAKKLAALKSGKAKDIVENFIAKEGLTKEGPAPLQVPVPKHGKNTSVNPNTPKKEAPPLASFMPQSLPADLSFLEEDNTPVKAQGKGNPRNLQENRFPDANGTQFLNEFKSKLRDRLAEKASTVEENSQQDNSIPEGYILINEQELQDKIVSISSHISKKMMTKVISDYAAQKKTITESANVKKAEIVGKNVVKIDGKLFNISPVKQ